MEYIFNILDQLNNFLWGYICSGLILIVGFWLSVQSKWVQIFKVKRIFQVFLNYYKNRKIESDEPGSNPIKVLFASLGGCIGIGTVATVASAVQIGGPGSLIWLWVAALLGSILKYAEIYLGVKYRVKIGNNYAGGPMYFLQKAFPNKYFISIVMALMLGIYGIETYMFSVIKESVVSNFPISSEWVSILLIILILIGVTGGVDRVGNICGKILPIFLICYVCMTSYVCLKNIAVFPELAKEIFKYAFTSHAAIGGFVGGSVMLTVAKGISAGCYTGDIGVGYASIIHSETNTNDPAKQAGMAIFSIYIDTFFICTCTVLLLLVTNSWTLDLSPSLLVQKALSNYFPYTNIFMPSFIFILGYTTLIAYLLSGTKCAKFISPKYGEFIYYIVAVCIFYFFSKHKSHYALTIMNISGAFLMLINIAGIIKLRKDLRYDI